MLEFKSMYGLDIISIIYKNFKEKTMKKLSILLAAMMIMSIFVGCTKTETPSTSSAPSISESAPESTSTPAPEAETYKNINAETGAFTITVGGKVLPVNMSSIAPVTVDIFFDPNCPPCVELETVAADMLSKKLEDKEISLTYHPLMFLSRWSIDDYSARLAGAAIAVAEYAPDSADKFVKTILNADFKPAKPDTDTTSDEKIFEAMKSCGVTDEQLELIKANLEKMTALSVKATEIFSTDKNIADLSPSEDDPNTTQNEKAPFTPFVLINKAGEFTNKALAFESPDIIAELEAAFAAIK
jgi:protein-disulfide isomerase